jgi:undecaprenyl-diphosphatase
MSFFEALILAIVEGLTEFLPVSSTGHMIIASSFMGIASEPLTKTFTISIQFGAILSVIVLYWRKFLPVGGLSQIVGFYGKLLIAFIPAAVLGLLLNDYIDLLLERVDVVGYTLVLGGFLFLFIDKLFHETEKDGLTEVSYPTAFKIGLFQTIAMVPGVSRSAATIIGGLTQKLTKQSAAEFSFFLAVPTMFAATAYKLYKFYSLGNSFENADIKILVFGNVVAFIVAIFAIKSFISFLTSHGFKIFGYYRIFVGLLILTFYYLGIQLSIV